MIALVENLQSKEPFYVRCVKPNEKKSPMLFDDKRCQHQVEYLGLLENVRVRRAGYAYRMTYERFVQRCVYFCVCAYITLYCLCVHMFVVYVCVNILLVYILCVY